MTVANVVRGSSDTLPEELQLAQDAIHLPEVQEMMLRLAEFNLGVFMPHMHDDGTGAFRALPEGVTQVEDDLKVSFRRDSNAGARTDCTYLPVGWLWREGGSVTARECVMMGTMHTTSDTPDPPDTPDTPDAPDTPDTPDVPDTPDTPDTPDDDD